MIAFYCQGGLGNQLFQYAAALQLATEAGCPLVLDPYWFDHPARGETPRRLALPGYGLPLTVATAGQQRRWRLLRSRLARPLAAWLPLRPVRERAGGPARNPLAARPGQYLMGYWQSEAYFTNVRSTLLGALRPTTTTADDARVLDSMRRVPSVSLHVRRGDYVSLASAAAFHGLCSLDYYQRAIDHMVGQLGAPEFFVFSDDPAWVREHLRCSHPMHFVTHNQGSPDRDMHLMSQCGHHIIANSSFSWWGAWLGEPQDRIVVAPRAWFAHDPSPAGMLPARWIRL